MEGRPKTSFQKKGAPKFPNILGTKPSLYNYQLLSSTGVPALDNLLGGGLPVGTLILIEDHPRPEGEDETDIGSDYSTVLLKYFMCEGAAHQHSLFFGSCCEKPERFFSNLPEVVVKASSLSETPGN
jgi:elongator complex protein 4